MLSCRRESLPTEADKDLRAWLGKTAAQTFVRVLDAYVKESQCAGLLMLHESSEYPNKEEAAKAAFALASKYQSAIDIFRKLSEQQEPYTIAKVS